MDSRRCIELIWHQWAAARGRDPAPFLRAAHGRRTSETLRLVAPELDVAAETATLDAMEAVETHGLFPAPGAAILIDALPASRWAIVTSGSRAVASLRLRAAGLPTPEVFVTGEAVARGKPDPEGYLLAARRLGVSPAQCVVIEDAPPGVAAGKAAGMRVIAVLTTHQASALQEADLRLETLSALRVRPAVDGGLLLE